MQDLETLKRKEGDAKAGYLTAKAELCYKRKIYRLAKASRKRHQRFARLDAKRDKALTKAEAIAEDIKSLEAEAKGRKRITVTGGK